MQHAAYDYKADQNILNKKKKQKEKKERKIKGWENFNSCRS